MLANKDLLFFLVPTFVQRLVEYYLFDFAFADCTPKLITSGCVAQWVDKHVNVS